MARESHDTGLDRRTLLKKGSLLAGAGAATAGVAGLAAAPAHAAEWQRVTYDVACLGDTFRILVHPDANPQGGELRGSTFSVEGSIYRNGTIPGSGFDPAGTERGAGLTNVEDRARAVGGDALIESSPGRGTRLLIRIPLR